MPAKRKRSKKEKVGEKEQLLKELRGKVSVAQDIIVHGKHVKNYIQHNQQLAREIRNRQSEIQNQLKKVAHKEGSINEKIQDLTIQEELTNELLKQLSEEEELARKRRKEMARLEIALRTQDSKVSTNLRQNSNIIKLLENKESDISRREKIIQSERSLLEQSKKEVIKFQQLLAKQSDEHEKENKQLEQRRIALEEKQAKLEEVIAHARDARRQMTALEKGIATYEALKHDVEKAKLDIRERAKEVERAQKELLHLERVRAGTQTIIEQKEELLRTLRTQEERMSATIQQAKYAQKTISELHATQQAIKDEQSRLAELKQALAEKEKRANELAAKAHIVEKEAEHNKQERADLESLRADLSEKISAGKDLDRKLKQLLKDQSKLTEDRENLQDQFKLLKERETKIAQREKYLTSCESEAQSREEHVAKEQKILDSLRAQLILEKNKLADFEHSIGARVAIFAEQIDTQAQFITTSRKDTKDMIKSVKNIVEKDLTILSEKEAGLKHTVQDNTKWKSRLEHEERTLRENMRKYKKDEESLLSRQRYHEQRETDISQKEKEIEKARADIARQNNIIKTEFLKIERAKELRSAIPRLEKQHARLAKLVKEARGRLMQAAVDPKIEEQVLKEKERELAELEERVERRIGDMLSQEHAKGIHPETHQPIFSHGNIHEELQHIKELISTGDMDRAARRIAEVEVLMDKIKRGEEKQILNYEVKILKHNLKLASLD